MISPHFEIYGACVLEGISNLGDIMAEPHDIAGFRDITALQRQAQRQLLQQQPPEPEPVVQDQHATARGLVETLGRDHATRTITRNTWMEKDMIMNMNQTNPSQSICNGMSTFQKSNPHACQAPDATRESRAEPRVRRDRDGYPCVSSSDGRTCASKSDRITAHRACATSSLSANPEALPVRPTIWSMRWRITSRPALASGRAVRWSSSRMHVYCS